MSNPHIKMYILVKDYIRPKFIAVSVAHASLACYLKFKDDPEVIEWLSGPFYKVICEVNDQDFEKAKTFSDHVAIQESSLNNLEIAIAFKPKKDWDNFFRHLPLYK